MRHSVLKRKLSMKYGMRKAYKKQSMRNLFLHRKLTTTDARAKFIRPIAEKAITSARRIIAEPSEKTLHIRRKFIHQIGEDALKQLLDIAKGYMNRPGGYLRLIKIGSRWGDSAPMTSVSFV